MLRCPHCKQKLLQASNGAIKLRSDGPLLFKNDECLTKCYWCKKAVAVPVQLHPGARYDEDVFFVAPPRD